MSQSLEVFHELGTRQLNVLCALHFLAGGEGTVTVSHSALAGALGWRRSSGVRQSVIDLERHGLVTVTNNSMLGANRPNTFTVLPLGHVVAENYEAMEAA
ncbi:hypothetical protein CFK38_06235 [Brachybacterium vulturis]|uniref:MarR family transcriptional regulator n=1 Tax=Brachybacterium vulturis TaxID=2017484 RepID=A0A291GLW5_9MICO|nr:hypothetical protein [Brachybacterium vulturis]ATG51167.1 hypothetical protein CFK38_06235 [Brachybacterium vulturis]